MATGLSITQQRWHVFKQHRLGYSSLKIAIFITLVTLFSNWIANDKPLLISYKGHFYTPIVSTYAETSFGGEFKTEAEYHSPYVQKLIQKHGWIIWPLIPFSPKTISLDPTSDPRAPSKDHWLGTDPAGHDVLTHLLYGLRLSILFGLSLTIICSIIGIFVGAIQGFYGGYIDLIGQRIIEIWSGMPLLYILIILSSFITPSFFSLLAIMTVFGWMQLVGLVRAEFLKTRNFEYVKAARALGLSNHKIIFKHVLPNALTATISFLPFILTASITTLTALDFLGLGMPMGTPSLGSLLAISKNNLHAPWLGLSVFITLAMFLSLLLFIGEAARDALDPHAEELQ
ncbi:MAG TPA: ABC transporter permease [Gammaproteobacteria bacterium]|nr:ABC transporter permease [Gammaproteobacteria bacterium]